MLKKSNKTGNMIIRGLGLLLLVYSATRSIDFIKITLPEERQILAYFALAALDIGLCVWTWAYLYNSHGEWQNTIAAGMIIIDVSGAIIMFTMDTLYNTGKMGLISAMTPVQIQNTVLALSGVIALNIVAVIAYELLSLDNIKLKKEEAAFAQIEEKSLEKIDKAAEEIAAQIAQDMAEVWIKKTKARYARIIESGHHDSHNAKIKTNGKNPIGQLSPPVEAAIFSEGNGNSHPKS